MPKCKKCGREVGITKNYTVVDVETPNNHNDKLCSIACINVENGEIKKEFYSLINPESNFSQINTRIHHISQKDILNSPIFPMVWDQIHSFFDGTCIVAHNANFDISVICKALEFYSIPIPTIKFVDTLSVLQENESSLGIHSFGLADACEYFSIELDQHHNALADAKSCKSLFECVSSNVDAISPDTFRYSYRNQFDLTADRDRDALFILRRMIRDAIDDNYLSDDEIYEIKNWLDGHKFLLDTYPYQEILQTINAAIQDGNIDSFERKKIHSLLDVDASPGKRCLQNHIDSAKEKAFCLSGNFSIGSKDEITKKLEDIGAIVKTGISKKVDFLVVGNEDCDAWKYGNYGTKVKKALELQSKGVQITLITEDALLEILS